MQAKHSSLYAVAFLRRLRTEVGNQLNNSNERAAKDVTMVEVSEQLPVSIQVIVK